MFGSAKFHMHILQYARGHGESVNRIKEIISAYKAEFQIDSEIDPASWFFKIPSKNVAGLELSVACPPDTHVYAQTLLYKNGKPLYNDKVKTFSNLTELIEEIKRFLLIDSN